MKIYKKETLIRFAGELLCKDFAENKDFHFTNTSYGYRGDVCGTIVSKNIPNHSEHLIQYLLSKEHWNDNSVSLIKHTRDTYYKKADREYKDDDKETVIQKLFILDHNDSVYTDNEDAANNASDIRMKRYRADRTYRNTLDLFRGHTLTPRTPLYDKCFTHVVNETGKSLKYGIALSLSAYKQNREEYVQSDKPNANGYYDYVKAPMTEIVINIGYTYRNKLCYTLKNTVKYKRNEEKKQ